MSKLSKDNIMKQQQKWTGENAKCTCNELIVQINKGTVEELFLFPPEFSPCNIIDKQGPCCPSVVTSRDRSV